MKIKKVEQVIKRSKILYVYRGGTFVWVGDGQCFYPLSSAVGMTLDNLCMWFDISEEDKCKYIIKELDLPTTLDFTDVDNEEKSLNTIFHKITAYKRSLEALVSTKGVFFLDTYYLKPFDDIKNKFTLVERVSDDGFPYIAVKDGMFLIGIILPFAVGDDFIDGLTAVSKGAEKYYNFIQAKKEEVDNE